MNRKGTNLFLPLLVIATLVVLTSMALTINQVKEEREEHKIGLIPLALFALYDEGERIQIYTEKAITLSEQEALKRIYGRGGYADYCTEKFKIPSGTAYNLLNECKSFNPSEEWELAYKKELQTFFKIYTSPNLKRVNLRKFYEQIGLVTEIQEAQWPTPESIFQETKKITIQREAKETRVTIGSLVLKSELFPDTPTQKLSYTLETSKKIQTPQFTFLRNFYKVLSSCPKEAEQCKEYILQNYPQAELSIIDGVIKADIQEQDFILKFAFDSSQPMPPYTEPVFK